MVAVMAIELEGARHVTRQALWRLANGAAGRARDRHRQGVDRQRAYRDDHAARAPAPRRRRLRRRARAPPPHAARQAGRATLRVDRGVARGSWPTQLAARARAAVLTPATAARSLLVAVAGRAAALHDRPGGFTVARFIVGGLVGLPAAAPRSHPTAGSSCSRRPAAFASGRRRPGSRPRRSRPRCRAARTPRWGCSGSPSTPAFARNGFLYLYHTQPPGRGPGAVRGRRRRRADRTASCGSRCPATASISASLVVLLDGIRTDNGNHDGGCLRIGPDGFLYVGVGDTGRGDGGPPGDSTNPYARDLGASQRQDPAAHARRRPGTRQSVPGTRRRGGLRLRVRPAQPVPLRLRSADGAALGRSTSARTPSRRSTSCAPATISGGRCCEGVRAGLACPGGTVPPVHAYPHTENGASVTGGVFYEGEQFDAGVSAATTSSVTSSSTSYGARELDAARTGFDGEPDVFVRDAGGPVDFTVGPDGALYYVAFSRGQVVRVTQDGAGGTPTGCSLALVKTAPRAPAGCRTPAGGLRPRLSVAAAVPSPACAAAPRVSGGTSGPVRAPGLRAVRDVRRSRVLSGCGGSGDRHRGCPCGCTTGRRPVLPGREARGGARGGTPPARHRRLCPLGRRCLRDVGAGPSRHRSRARLPDATSGGVHGVRVSHLCDRCRPRVLRRSGHRRSGGRARARLARRLNRR